MRLGVSNDFLQLSDVFGFERRIFRFSETLDMRSFAGFHRKYCVNMYSYSWTNLRYTVLHTTLTRRLNWTVYLRWLNVTVGSSVLTVGVCHTAAISSGLQCRQFVGKKFKQWLKIYSPHVKHVWELEVVFNTKYNVW